ncbi:MAG: TlpA family protein disulfide reductase [Nannocystaceae bacterium]
MTKELASNTSEAFVMALPPADEKVSELAYIGDTGRTVHGWMQLPVEVLGDNRVHEMRLGDQRVLATETIHIVNLWNVHCKPCKEEMPALRRLFNRRSDWRSGVKFVALQVLDDQSPQYSYAQISSWLPPHTLKLADRSRDAKLTQVLASPRNGELYGGTVPMTLVLDCNRRVRWHVVGKLNEANLDELEDRVDQMRSELLRRGEDEKCGEVWCGNGRCESGETLRGSVCEDDCGPVRFVSGRERAIEWAQAEQQASRDAPQSSKPTGPTRAGKAASSLLPTKIRTKVRPATKVRDCSAECRHCVHGQCVELIGDKPEPVSGYCGDGICSPPNETPASCCRDCSCQPGLTCRKHVTQGWMCQRGLIGG